ncbi:unnamed protein product [Albugo candida]|uniref:Uncharacterized protein n=1 Tax=Albugo candida TaxID=65357 RepID=A0A024GBU8_9STRA|nr:unnamed protein product [Albugo candida]|eukprot:CCI43995.1 unnamed protein product [Albugo candida]
MQRKRASHHFFGFWSLARALTAQRTSNYFRVIYGLVPSDSQGELEKLLTGFPQSSPGFISIENGSVVRATAKPLMQKGNHIIINCQFKKRLKKYRISLSSTNHLRCL